MHPRRNLVYKCGSESVNNGLNTKRREEKLQECRETFSYKYKPFFLYIICILIICIKIYIFYINDFHIGGEPEGCITTQNGEGVFLNYTYTFPPPLNLFSIKILRYIYTHVGMTENHGLDIPWSTEENFLQPFIYSFREHLMF